MKKLIKFNPKYFTIALLILCTEVIIALFIRDRFIRPYLGDVLVVIMVYCFVKSIFNITPIKAAVISFVFACLVEAGQYFHLVELLGLKENKFASVVIGNSFSWEDIIAYLVGAVIVVVTDRKNKAAIYRN